MDLRRLRYFIAVAEEGHITRAAERLGMQQPPLTQQIKAMERELDVQLFRRKPRGVVLTEAGQALLEDARAVIERVDLAVASARRTARGEQGRIAIGATSSAPFHPLVSRAIRAFRDSHPLVSLAFAEGNGGELHDALRTQKIDVAFIRSHRPAPPELVLEPLLNERMVVALPAGHPLAATRRGGDKGLPMAALAGETFVLYASPAPERAVSRSGPTALAGETFVVYGQPVWPGLYEPILAACRAAGFSPNVGQFTRRILSAVNLVAAGFGISIVPASLQQLHMDGLVLRPIKGRPQVTAPLNLVFRRGEASAAVRRFINLARQIAKELGKEQQ